MTESKPMTYDRFFEEMTKLEAKTYVGQLQATNKALLEALEASKDLWKLGYEQCDARRKQLTRSEDVIKKQSKVLIDRIDAAIKLAKGET